MKIVNAVIATSIVAVSTAVPFAAQAKPFEIFLFQGNVNTYCDANHPKKKGFFGSYDNSFCKDMVWRGNFTNQMKLCKFFAKGTTKTIQVIKNGKSAVKCTGEF